MLTGLHTLKIKETDRITALVNELAKFGFEVETNGVNNLFWNGKMAQPCSNIKISTSKDHRMAMSFAPAALETAPLVIDDPMVVTKSYPGYWNDLEAAGFELSFKGNN